MAVTLQVRDANGSAIPALSPVTSETVKVTSGASSASVALPSGYDLVRVYATEGAFINFGSSGVTASASTDMPVSKEAPEVFVVQGYTHIAAIQGSTAGEVIVTPVR